MIRYRPVIVILIAVLFALLSGQSRPNRRPKSSAPARTSRPASPTGKPTTTRPASQPSVPAFEPLWDAAEGEWAVYSALENREIRYDVTRVTGAGVATRVTVHQDKKLLGQPALREDPRDFDPLTRQAGASHAQRQMTPAKIEIAGRKWDARLYEDRWTDEDVHYVRKTWVSKDAPVFGVLRMELKGDDKLEGRLELKAFGKK